MIEIISLIYAAEKRYYQNKTQLRYNFDSVYIVLVSWNVIICHNAIDNFNLM